MTAPLIDLPRKSSGDFMSDLRKIVVTSETDSMRSVRIGSERGVGAMDAAGDVKVEGGRGEGAGWRT
jgi:hypothetical protein